MHFDNCQLKKKKKKKRRKKGKEMGSDKKMGVMYGRKD